MYWSELSSILGDQKAKQRAKNVDVGGIVFDSLNWFLWIWIVGGFWFFL